MAKHNKKRNTMFIYETLLREVVKQSIKKNRAKRNIAIDLLKEHFQRDTALGTELELYKTLLHTRNLTEKMAEKLIGEAVKQHTKINQKALFTEQSAVIAAINKKISRGVFANFVPNYKDLATIAQIFSNTLKPKSKVLLENRLMQRLATPTSAAEAAPSVSRLVVKNFIKRFNDEYEGLFKEQKELLSKYIGSFTDGGIEFRFYLNEEIGRLKEVVEKGFHLQEVRGDGGLKEKLTEVKGALNNFNKKPIEKEEMMSILKIQTLARELTP
jgi:hypothetical protein